jgi:hypothetical protein
VKDESTQEVAADWKVAAGHAVCHHERFFHLFHEEKKLDASPPRPVMMISIHHMLHARSKVEGKKQNDAKKRWALQSKSRWYSSTRVVFALSSLEISARYVC